MIKTLGMLLTAVAVVAVSVPAVASAAPELTNESAGGTFGKTPLGTGILGTSTNAVVKTSIGNLTCAKVEDGSEVTENSGTSVKIGGIGAAKTTTCLFKGTTPITIHDWTTTSLHATEPGKGVINVTFQATLPELTCHYSGTAVPFTYASGTDTIHIKGALVSKPAPCGTSSIETTKTVTVHEQSAGVTILRPLIWH